MLDLGFRVIKYNINNSNLYMPVGIKVSPGEGSSASSFRNVNLKRLKRLKKSVINC